MRISFSTIAIVVVMLFSSTIASSAITVGNTGVVTNSYGGFGRWFDYVVVIMMENHSINYTYGTPVLPNSWNNMSRTCLGNCTFFDSLANQNGLALSYTNNGVTDGSVSDYTAITSGDGSLSSACNDGPLASGCSPPDIPNIVDRIESARLTWKAYMEDLPSQGCDQNFESNYFPNHNPFVYYHDVINNTSRCNRIIPANSHIITQSSCPPTAVQTDDNFLADLTPTRASNYMFLTPNSIDDIHNCNDVSVANNWLQNLIPRILNSPLFQTRRSAILVTFDEAGCTDPPGQIICPSAGPQLYTVWASNSTGLGSTTLSGHKSNTAFTHFSALRTVEDNWHLPILIPSADGSASNMREFFSSP